MRILSPPSKDPELMRIFNEPEGDVHKETSDWMTLNDRNIANEINQFDAGLRAGLPQELAQAWF